MYTFSVLLIIKEINILWFDMIYSYELVLEANGYTFFST